MEHPGVTTGGETIPVSLLTGFLGSGKTTLLGKLLTHPFLARTAVVINEFGEIGLDHDLIESSTENLVLLQSGCLCCTIRGDLIDTMRKLFLKRVRGEVPEFDRVVIETTGLADPAPILHTLMTDPLVSSRFRLDGVIVTVDSAVGQQTLDRHIESVKQVAVADRLVLTKSDLVGDLEVEKLRRRLLQLNPAAPIISAVNGAVSPAVLFDAGLYDPHSKTLDVQRWLKAEAYRQSEASHEHAHHDDPRARESREHGADDHSGHVHEHHDGHDRDVHHDHHHAHDVNRHDEHIRAICLNLDRPIPSMAFDLWLESILLIKGPNILRLKAILNVADFPEPVVIHGVQHVFHPPVTLKAWPTPDQRSRIVMIVHDLSETVIAESLRIIAESSASLMPTPATAA